MTDILAYRWSSRGKSPHSDDPYYRQVPHAAFSYLPSPPPNPSSFIRPSVSPLFFRIFFSSDHLSLSASWNSFAWNPFEGRIFDGTDAEISLAKKTTPPVTSYFCSSFRDVTRASYHFYRVSSTWGERWTLFRLVSSHICFETLLFFFPFPFFFFFLCAISIFFVFIVNEWIVERLPFNWKLRNEWNYFADGKILVNYLGFSGWTFDSIWIDWSFIGFPAGNLLCVTVWLD